MNVSTRDDGFYLATFEQGDDAVAAVPDAVFRAPDFIGFDLSAAGKHDYGFAALAGCDAWSTRRDRVAGRAGVSGRVC